MNNFGTYYTPEEYYEIDRQWTLEELRSKANMEGSCETCETEEVWRLVDTGMCFTCTTGESDASDDIELKKG